MNKFLIYLLGLTLISCQKSNKVQSKFFKDFQCEKLKLENSKVITDTLNLFTMKVIDSTWLVFKTKEGDDASSITQQKIYKNDESYMDVRIAKFIPPWNQEEEDKELKRRNKIIQHGKIDSMYWYEMQVKRPYTKTIFWVYVNLEKNLLLSAQMSTTDPVDPELRICEMENVIQTIKLN